MKDRVPVYPGRVKLVPVSGQENVYDMTRADQPTQQGDPLNKATLLKDATAALFGLGTDAVPDDVLAYLGKYAQHWWKRTRIPQLVQEAEISFSQEGGYITTVDEGFIRKISFPVITGSSSAYKTLTYYDSIQSVSADGSVEFGTSHTISYSYYDVMYGRVNLSVLRGKFYVSDDLTIVKVGASATQKYGEIPGDKYAMWMSTVYPYTIDTIYDPEYVQSPDRSAYPDSGEQGGYEYQYLGIPFENAATAPKIATGSYVGTGKYGSSNPNSLTLGFAPKLIFLYALSGVDEEGYNINKKIVNIAYLVYNLSYASTGGGASSTGSTLSYVVRVSWLGDGVSWYAYGSSANAIFQHNNAGTIYYYFAIG